MRKYLIDWYRDIILGTPFVNLSLERLEIRSNICWGINMTTMEFDGVDSVCTLERGILRICIVDYDLKKIDITDFWGGGAGFFGQSWYYTLMHQVPSGSSISFWRHTRETYWEHEGKCDAEKESRSLQ